MVGSLSLIILQLLSAILATHSLAMLTPKPFDPAKTIVFDSPADHFYESCPIGNGRLGAMVFGRPQNERVVLNESTMWSGSAQDADDADAYKVLPEIRRLLLSGENRKAQQLLQAHFICKGPGSGSGQSKDGPYGCYQIFGNLEISSEGKEAKNYRRDLDLDRAVTTMEWEEDGVKVYREAVASAPRHVIAYHFAASRPKNISFDAKLSRAEHASTRLDGNQLILEGQLPSGNPKIPGVRFHGRLTLTHKGGVVTIDSAGIHLKDADEATLLFAGMTDMFDKDFVAQTTKAVTEASGIPFERLRDESVRDYQRFFRRVELELPKGSSAAKATQDRLAASQKGEDDPSLAALYFNFGRYLLIQSSRPDSPLPTNLQGIWAEELQTPWNGDFHLDINVQMNYWPSEICNLSDCHRPLLDFIPKLVPNGERTAKAYYNASGWVAHVITNPWLFTSPGEGADWGSTCSGSGWLCEDLWRHYQYTLDRAYLDKVYPVMRGAAQFYLDMLIEEPSHHWLVTAPSNSPENAFLHGQDGAVNTCMGPTFDNQILRELFGNVIAAATELGVDADLRTRLETARNRLPPTRIGKFGQVMEWLEDYPETDIHHRHCSPLFGLYPSDQISPGTTPDLASAAKTTLNRRGDLGTGWSLAWKVCFWARLWDGDHAWTILKRLFKPTRIAGFDMENGGGTYPNLFDAHPPFQIDGNFGATAGIAEMLLQSSQGSIRLLPALPKAWSSRGRVKGLKAKGGISVDIAWEGGEITSYHLSGAGSGSVKVEFGIPAAAGLRRS